MPHNQLTHLTISQHTWPHNQATHLTISQHTWPHNQLKHLTISQHTWPHSQRTHLTIKPQSLTVGHHTSPSGVLCKPWSGQPQGSYLLVMCTSSSMMLNSPMMTGPASAMMRALGWTTVLAPAEPRTSFKWLWPPFPPPPPQAYLPKFVTFPSLISSTGQR